ncbi:FAD/NAD(P)-binding protein [bacterium]|nr:FAD/NAD(P)-binding protein [bacterium]
MKTPANPFRPIPATLEAVIPETDGIKSFIIRPEIPFDFICGQFAELTLPGVGEAPFAMASPSTKPDTLKFTIQKAGYMTEKLHALTPGELLGVRGPYGNGFAIENYFGKKLLLVIGGVGFPPAMALLHTAIANKDKLKSIHMCYGARSPGDIVYKDAIAELRENIQLDITVDNADDTWEGPVGVVTTLLKKDEIDPHTTIAVVIGPPIMMKFATLRLLELDFKPKDIVLSMERKMYCGIGQCRHCMIDHYFICKDGPVFTYDQLQESPDIWE